MSKERISLVSPALASANNGNSHTAARWQRFLAPLAEVTVEQSWSGDPVQALIALHARRSAPSIAAFRAAHPARPLALVLTGTDLYHDLGVDAQAQHSLRCASHLVVLQDEGLRALDDATRAKARVIVQSASRLLRHDKARRHVDVVAVGHLRDEKDPLTLMRAVRLLGADSSIRVIHIGRALDPDLGREAERTMAQCPRYRWLGGLPAPVARRWIARGRVVVHMSRIEGGAHVVIEAVRSQVPVLASRIAGNVGLLGPDYFGYFETGDAAALAALMQRFADERAFAAALAAQCARREPLFAPQVERAAVRRLLADLLAGRGSLALPQ